MEDNFITILCKPTHECNMDCEYCYDKKEKKLVNNKRIPIDLLEKTIKISLKGFKNITWIWHGGEATLMGKDFFVKAKELFDKYKTDEHNIEFLIQSNGKNISDTYDWLNELGIKPGYSYDITNDNSLRKESFEVLEKLDKKVGVITVVSDPYCNLVDVFKKYEDRGMLSFNKIFFNDISKEYNHTEFAKRYIELFEYILWKKDVTIERNIRDIIKMCCLNRDDISCIYRQCLKNLLCINPDGYIFSCDRFGMLDMKYNLGNVKDYESLYECFSSQGFLNEVKDDFEFRKNNCEKCNINMFCRNICKCNRVDRNNMIDISKSNTAECNFRKILVNYIFNRLFNLSREELLKINYNVYKLLMNNKFLFKFIIDDLEEKGVKDV